MNLFKTKPKIEFYSVNFPQIYNYPIEPISTVNRPWLTNIKENVKNKYKNPHLHNSSSYLCSGIREIMNTGYVLRAHHDFIIKTNGDGETFEWSTPDSSLKPIGFFSPEQYGDYGPLPEQTLRSLIKIETPWRVILPKGWKLLVLPVTYIENQPFTSSIGILDTQISREINPILFWHNLNGEEFIEAGTPICQLIPIKTQITEFEIRKASDKELEYEKIVSVTMLSKWGTSRRSILKDIQEKFFGQKKCPFHRGK